MLLIVVDDLRPALGAFGNDIVQTPNIDRIASWGVRFERAYSQSPLCGPSRVSMLTGRYPTQTDVWDNLTWYKAIHPDFVSLPRQFREHGYTTLRAGKIYHRKMDEPEAWTEGGQQREFVGAKSPKSRAPKVEASDRVQELDGDGESHHDYRNTTRAIELLERHRNDRFFLALGLSKPHAPLAAPRRLLDLYDVSAMLLPPDFARRPTVPPGFPSHSVPRQNSDLFVGRDASPAQAREMIRGYYAATSFSDSNIGRVVQALERLGLRRNTVIVLWSDHGYHLGEKGKWSKHDSLFEVGLRVPLIIASPSHGHSAGSASRRVVESLDLYATFVDLCGVPRPPGVGGRSLRPLLEDPEAVWDHPAYSMARFPSGIAASIRTERWRYAAWSDGQSMLFDHRDDPAEVHNRASDPAHAEVVRRMRGLLVQIPRWGVPPLGSRDSSSAFALHAH